jgi:hypothetical protein
MSSQPPKFLIGIYRLPIIGNLSCYVGNAFLNLFGIPALWLSGYKQIKCGTSIIWTPNNKRQIILAGIECLRSHDAEMFSRLTKKQRLFIYYSHEKKTTNLYGYIFGLHESYIKLGAEGVAYFIVQVLLISDASPSINQFRLSNLERVALKATLRKTMEWMQQHSFDPRLINSYSKTVEKWEQRTF